MGLEQLQLPARYRFTAQLDHAQFRKWRAARQGSRKMAKSRGAGMIDGDLLIAEPARQAFQPLFFEAKEAEGRSVQQRRENSGDGLRSGARGQQRQPVFRGDMKGIGVIFYIVEDVAMIVDDAFGL